MDKIICEVITPNGPYKTIETPSLLLGTIDGQRGLLPNHMPIVLMLDISRMETVENGVKKHYAVSGGVVYFEKGTAKVLVDSIESSDEIDVQRAMDAKDRAEKRIHGPNENVDLRRAEIALKKAINRISVSSYR